MNRPLGKDFDPRNPATWPDYCTAIRSHPLVPGVQQRCVRLRHEGDSHTWETP